jgi:transposase-like protein
LERRKVETKALVALLLQRGSGVSEIAATLGLAPSTVCHHARSLGHPACAKYARRYDWTEVRRYYDAGHTVRECQAKFGFAKQTWNSAISRGDIRPRPRGLPVDALLIAGRPRNRGTVKKALVRAGLKESRCEDCGISEWRGKPLSLALHHVNGDGHDNRLENLRLLCPNCHSLTENFAGRGVVGRARTGALRRA